MLYIYCWDWIIGKPNIFDFDEDDNEENGPKDWTVQDLKDKFKSLKLRTRKYSLCAIYHSLLVLIGGKQNK